MSGLVLNVPFDQKDEVKALGARWNASEKAWFVPSGLDPKLFREWWLDFALQKLYVLTAIDRCWRCHKPTLVATLASDKLYESDDDYIKCYDDPLIYSFIEFLPKSVLREIQKVAPKYYRDFSKTAGTKYFMNHCSHCNAKFGDFLLHNDPGATFCPLYEEDCEGMEMFELDTQDKTPIYASYSLVNGIRDWLL